MKAEILFLLFSLNISLLIAQGNVPNQSKDSTILGDKNPAMFQKSTVTDIDGNVYKTIKIGKQWWMVENLKVTKYRDGKTIPNVTNGETWSTINYGAYCAYDNNNENIEIYGLLYNWYAVDDTSNIAPLGWHVATDEEWKTLELYLGITPKIANKIGWRLGPDKKNRLMATTGWFNNDKATNQSGFTALPGGHRFSSNGKFRVLGRDAYWWTASVFDSSYAWYRNQDFNGTMPIRSYNDKHYGFSVRCVKD